MSEAKQIAIPVETLEAVIRILEARAKHFDEIGESLRDKEKETESPWLIFNDEGEATRPCFEARRVRNLARSLHRSIERADSSSSTEEGKMIDQNITHIDAYDKDRPRFRITPLYEDGSEGEGIEIFMQELDGDKVRIFDEGSNWEVLASLGLTERVTDENVTYLEVALNAAGFELNLGKVEGTFKYGQILRAVELFCGAWINYCRYLRR